MDNPLKSLKDELSDIAGKSAERQDKIFNRLEELLEKYPDRGAQYIETLISNSKQEQRLRTASLVILILIITTAAVFTIDEVFDIHFFSKVSAKKAVAALSEDPEDITFQVGSKGGLQARVDSDLLNVASLDPTPHLRLNKRPGPGTRLNEGLESVWISDLYAGDSVVAAERFHINTLTQVFGIKNLAEAYQFGERIKFDGVDDFSFKIIDYRKKDSTYSIEIYNGVTDESKAIDVRTVQKTDWGRISPKRIAKPYRVMDPSLDHHYLLIIGIGKAGSEPTTRPEPNVANFVHAYALRVDVDIDN